MCGVSDPPLEDLVVVVVVFVSTCTVFGLEGSCMIVSRSPSSISVCLSGLMRKQLENVTDGIVNRGRENFGTGLYFFQ